MTGQRSNQLNYLPLVFQRLVGNPLSLLYFLLFNVSPVSNRSTPYIKNSRRNGHMDSHAKK